MYPLSFFCNPHLNQLLNILLLILRKHTIISRFLLQSEPINGIEFYPIPVDTPLEIIKISTDEILMVLELILLKLCS
ncbi:protein of unknown function [Candidatus Nitrosocosmicus franklandus]|uniref:Uncharacterized protein n=1 Tax=Candidatus Nitrosocosmicus franklandianus TaxID=1798806 RepID=A0A484I8E1_9ARCH|nr:protein of unknown function [Candidatus Nitrosocosmicus franklandus]